MTEFKVPELGENGATGDVTRVLANVGDTIKKEQPVLELETDKATIEVPSSVDGVVKEIKVKKGDKVKVGAVVLTVDGAGSNGGGAAPKQDAAPTQEAATKQDAAPKQEPAAKPEAAAPPAEAQKPPQK